ncbi:MAG: hypothetical protein R3E50_11210 [Halioglobus sp.]
MVAVDDGICFLYEGDAGYHDANEAARGARHRLYMVNNQLDYFRET